MPLETLRALKRMGVRISIDDFGTGYSAGVSPARTLRASAGILVFSAEELEPVLAARMIMQ